VPFLTGITTETSGLSISTPIHGTPPKWQTNLTNRVSMQRLRAIGMPPPLQGDERRLVTRRAAPAGHVDDSVHPDPFDESRNVRDHQPSQGLTALSGIINLSNATGPRVRLIWNPIWRRDHATAGDRRCHQPLFHGERDRRKRERSPNERGHRNVPPAFNEAAVIRRIVRRHISGTLRRNSVSAGKAADGWIDIATKRFLTCPFATACLTAYE